MKKIFLIVLSCIVAFAYYFYPRTVSFEFVEEIPLPTDAFDRREYIGFDYVESVDRLYFYLVEFYERIPNDDPKLKGYDRDFVRQLSEGFDFEKYDYLITYQKTLNKLQYSPYLTKEKDDIYFDKRTPLIPTWNKRGTDKVYVYRIKKNDHFRAPGP
ncbi:hypothetical protein [Porphyromonas miyakawae]|uniref:hypothetical protein n=1 Tax=Porphyromonas miyakawae TaxID=3137470 RepID=UPI00398C74F3